MSSAELRIPSAQVKFHIVTEALSVLFVPFIYYITTLLSGNDLWWIRWILYFYIIAIILVDGGLLLRWYTLQNNVDDKGQRPAGPVTLKTLS